jgi:hypothetical protein
MATVLIALAGCSGSYSSGDRVIVAKFLYDSGLARPERFDVVVFKYPEARRRVHDSSQAAGHDANHAPPRL